MRLKRHYQSPFGPALPRGLYGCRDLGRVMGIVVDEQNFARGGTQLTGRRLLIVDDNATNRRILKLQAERWDMVATAAASGREALHLLEQHAAFDLAILDMHMPGHTGLELLSVVRRETLAIPCMIWSGDMTDALHQMALHEGALAVLQKPIEPLILRREVRRALHLDPGLDHGPIGA